MHLFAGAITHDLQQGCSGEMAASYSKPLIAYSSKTAGANGCSTAMIPLCSQPGSSSLIAAVFLWPVNRLGKFSRQRFLRQVGEESYDEFTQC